MIQSIAKKRNLSFVITSVFLISIFLISRTSSWEGSIQLHTVMESIATLLAIIVGVLALTRFYAKPNEALFLLIGVGFLGTGVLDGYHTFVTSEHFYAIFPSPNESLIPWSWIASRLFLSVFMVFSYLNWKKNWNFSSNRAKLYWLSSVATIGAFLFFAFVPLPQAYYSELFFHRPEEFVPAIFFAIALYGFYTKGGWKENSFEYWLVLSLIVNLIAQIFFMSFSGHLFDYEFDMAHLLKKVSYILVLTGLVINMYRSFKNEVQSNETNERQNKELIIVKEEAVNIAKELEVKKNRFEFSEKVGNVGTWEYIIKTDEFSVSQQAKVIFGLPLEESLFSIEMIENCILENERVHQALVDLLEKDTEYNLEYEINSLDGNSTKIISSIGEVIKDENGVALKVIGSIKDITEMANLIKALECEKNRFSLAVEGAQDGLWDWDLETNSVILSERFETMLGYNVGDLPHNQEAWFGLLHPDDKEQAIKQVQKYLDTKGKGSYESSFRLRAKDGSWIWILGRGKAQFDEDGRPLRFVGFNTDISEQKEYLHKLDHTAKHDSLTHLPNRFLLSELLTQAMHTTKRNDKQLALLFVDLDGFKEVNDTYGHDAGDEVLSVVASRMENIVRESDIVSRIGGDEFVIVITDINKSEELTPILQHLLSDINLSIKHNENNMHVSASVGVSFYPQNIDIGNEALLRQSDQAMYIAKTEGRNRYHFFNIEASDELQENQQNIVSIREAIATNQFVLYYQPKVDMKNNKVVGLEALLRWNHPQKGLVYPDDFLPLIEHDFSLMVELGNWVFENAFSQLEAWYLQGLDIMLNINVSSHEIKQEDFSLYLKKLFDKYLDIKPNSIEIELLETSAFDDFELTSKILKECQELGVSIAVDDFGTGYASLHYLKKLPMNTLKIDKSFVIDLLHTSSSISIVEASLGLARAFNANVVAEGVESEEHGKVLLQLGCTIAQGYVIAKAMPAENVIEWIKSYKGFSSWTQIEPVKDRERTVLYAAIEHRSWINSIEDFIKNENHNLPILDASSCYLGRWISNCTSEEYLSHPEFKQLQTLHTQLHNYAEELLLSTKNNKLEGMEKLKGLRHEILEKLESLMTLVVDE